MTKALDFASLPSDEAFERRSILIGPSQELRGRLRSMPQTLERAEGAMMFAAQASKQGEPWRAAAFLRAALADFCSIEDVQKIDRSGGPYFEIRASNNPLVHLLALMRHLNVHVKSVEVNRHMLEVSFMGIDHPMEVFVISNLAASDLQALKNGKKHYDMVDLVRCVSWFETRQSEWGAGDLISMGTNIFAAQVCDHLGL